MLRANLSLDKPARALLDQVPVAHEYFVVGDLNLSSIA